MRRIVREFVHSSASVILFFTHYLYLVDLFQAIPVKLIPPCPEKQGAGLYFRSLVVCVLWCSRFPRSPHLSIDAHTSPSSPLPAFSPYNGKTKQNEKTQVGYHPRGGHSEPPYGVRRVAGPPRRAAFELHRAASVLERSIRGQQRLGRWRQQ